MDLYIDKIMYYMLLLLAFASSISTGATSVVVAVGLLLTLLKYMKNPFRISFAPELIRGISAFFAVLFLSALFSQNMMLSFDRILSTANRFIPILFVVVFVKKREQLVTILLFLSISIFIDDIYGIWQKINLPMRPFGFNNTPTFLGSHLLEMIPLCWVLSMEEYSLTKIQKVWFTIVTIISTIMLVLTDTRGAWLAMIAVCGVYLLLNRKKKFKIGVIIAVVAFVILLAIIYIPELHWRVLSIIDMNNPSNFERILMWQSSWRIIQDYPILGVGPGGFQHVYNTQYISPLAREMGHTSPHNNFILYLTETGVIGLTGFIYLFYCIFSYFIKQYYKNSKLILSLVIILATVGILFEGLTDHNFGQVSIMRLYWYLLGLAYIENRFSII